MNSNDPPPTQSKTDHDETPSSRVRRPRPARTRPIRDAALLFRHDDGTTDGLADTVSQSVRLGYSVIREQIERGRRTAQQLGGRAMSSTGSAGDLNDIGRRLLEFSSDFGALYGNLIEALTRLPGAVPSAGSAAAPQTDPGSGAVPARFVIDIDARCPSHVAFELEPGAGRSPLCVRALLGSASDSAPLTDVTIEGGAERPLLLRIVVPDAQPAGVYTGVVVERDTNLPKGTLSVTLLQP